MTNDAVMVIDPHSVLHDVSPYLFGGFVEDMHDHMEGMLAFCTVDMDFEENALEFPGVSYPWYPATDGNLTTYALEPAAPLHTGHSQRIEAHSKETCYAGIAQKCAVEKHTEYDVKLYLRASAGIRFVDVGLHNLQDGKLIDQARISGCSHDWREHTCTLSCESPVPNAELRISTNTVEQTWPDVHTNGIIWIDHVSMAARDAIGIVSKRVHDMARDLNCGIMRLGGNQMSCYHWKHFQGPTYMRPALKSEHWGHWTSKNFGIDEYLDFCSSLDVEPQICVNAGTGTVNEAVEWMEYCNGDESTPMGALRARNGHRAPYNVQFWEIGNELWGRRQVGHCNALEYSRRYRALAQALRDACPDITLIACGHYREGWNETLLREAAPFIDHLSLHYYHGLDLPGGLFAPGSDEERQFMVCSAEAMSQMIGGARRLIESNPRYRHIRISVTEYNVAYRPHEGQTQGPDHHSVEAAVSVAGMLNSFLRNGDLVLICNFSDLVNGWPGGAIRVTGCDRRPLRGVGSIPASDRPVIYGTPAYHVLRMYSRCAPSSLVHSKIRSPVLSLPGVLKQVDIPVNPIRECERPPVVDAVACLAQSGEFLVVYATNRTDRNVALRMEIAADVVSAEVCFVGGHGKKTINSSSDPERVAVQDGSCTVDNGGVLVEMVPISAYAIQIRLRGTQRADVPTPDGGADAAAEHQKTREDSQ